jgi:ribonuclease P protein component
VVVQARDRADDAPLVRAGFTATRKIGGAVVRNRAKRRLREAARVMLPLHGRPGFDYVFIARGGTTARPWLRLLDDMKSALISLAANQVSPATAPATASR